MNDTTWYVTDAMTEEDIAIMERLGWQGLCATSHEDLQRDAAVMDMWQFGAEQMGYPHERTVLNSRTGDLQRDAAVMANCRDVADRGYSPVENAYDQVGDVGQKWDETVGNFRPE